MTVELTLLCCEYPLPFKQLSVNKHLSNCCQTVTNMLKQPLSIYCQTLMHKFPPIQHIDLSTSSTVENIVVNLNTSTIEELRFLKAIRMNTAKAVCDYRKLSVSDLEEIPNVPLSKLMDFLCKGEISLEAESTSQEISNKLLDIYHQQPTVTYMTLC